MTQKSVSTDASAANSPVPEDSRTSLPRPTPLPSKMLAAYLVAKSLLDGLSALVALWPIWVLSSLDAATATQLCAQVDASPLGTGSFVTAAYLSGLFLSARIPMISLLLVCAHAAYKGAHTAAICARAALYLCLFECLNIFLVCRESASSTAGLSTCSIHCIYHAAMAAVIAQYLIPSPWSTFKAEAKEAASLLSFQPPYLISGYLGVSAVIAAGVGLYLSLPPFFLGEKILFVHDIKMQSGIAAIMCAGCLSILKTAAVEERLAGSGIRWILTFLAVSCTNFMFIWLKGASAGIRAGWPFWPVCVHVTGLGLLCGILAIVSGDVSAKNR